MKTKFRKEIIAKRKAFDTNCKTDSDKKIFDKLINLSEYKTADTIFAYVSYGFEVDTIEIIKYSLNVGKKVAVPICNDKMGNMSFKTLTSLDDLQKGMYGILEPKEFCVECTDYTNSLCLVPALAFDHHFNRIGYGKGYYDRFLDKFNGVSVGLCYNAFIVDYIPTDSYDKKVQIIITEKNKLL